MFRIALRRAPRLALKVGEGACRTMLVNPQGVSRAPIMFDVERSNGAVTAIVYRQALDAHERRKVRGSKSEPYP